MSAPPDYPTAPTLSSVESGKIEVNYPLPCEDERPVTGEQNAAKHASAGELADSGGEHALTAVRLMASLSWFDRLLPLLILIAMIIGIVIGK